MKRYIKSSTVQKSGCSFDFIHDGEYNYQDMVSRVEKAFYNAGVDVTGVDFRDVDYSDYPEYKDQIIGQCGVDFTWSDDYSPENIEIEVAAALEDAGFELIGIDFYSLD